MYELGQTIGDYQIVGVLGAGGMGKVYKVRNVISDRIEAMKVLLPNLESDPELADRFIREIKVQASLDHPNIAKLHTAQRVGNQLIMIMEFVEGRSLESLMRAGPIPLEDGVSYALQVLSALAYAHARGIVHRDIKPPNMMLTPNGTVKLMDFGIARVADADRKLTQTGRTVGSLFYMSPEQIQGGAVDARADLYSLGVSLYEMVTGKRPFQGDSDYSIMAAHLQSVPAPPIQLDPKLPSALSEIVMMSIARDPAQRFQSAEAFRGALQSVTSVAPASPPPEVRATSSSHRGLWVALGSLVTLGLIVAAATQVPRWLKTRAGEKPAPVVTTAPVQTPAPEPAPAAPTPTPPPTLEPAQPPPKATPKPRPVPTTPQATPAPAPAAQTPAPPAPAPSNAAELKELRQRMMLLAARIGPIKQSLDNLRREQSRMGLSLRTDIASAQQRVEYQMDEAERAIGAGDVAAAKSHLDLAERDLEKLEEFLGR